jgi:hypothetical protein
VKGLASYITSSNDSALVFPRIGGVGGETKTDGRSGRSFVQYDATLRIARPGGCAVPWTFQFSVLRVEHWLRHAWGVMGW